MYVLCFVQSIRHYVTFLCPVLIFGLDFGPRIQPPFMADLVSICYHGRRLENPDLRSSNLSGDQTSEAHAPRHVQSSYEGGKSTFGGYIKAPVTFSNCFQILDPWMDWFS